MRFQKKDCTHLHTRIIWAWKESRKEGRKCLKRAVIRKKRGSLSTLGIRNRIKNYMKFYGLLSI
jgi:hypothetical protein